MIVMPNCCRLHILEASTNECHYQLPLCYAQSIRNGVHAYAYIDLGYDLSNYCTAVVSADMQVSQFLTNLCPSASEQCCEVFFQQYVHVVRCHIN